MYGSRWAWGNDEGGALYKAARMNEELSYNRGTNLFSANEVNHGRGFFRLCVLTDLISSFTALLQAPD